MGDQTSTADERARRQFERLTFFSDAVFAIAITLLVLDLKAPVGAHGEPRLDKVVPNILAFCLSFYVIGIFWQAHHSLFGHLQREDAVLRRVNLLFLGTIVFLPFPTSVMSEFDQSTTTVTFYAASAGAVGLMQAVLVMTARRPGLMYPDDQLAPGSLARPLAAAVVFFASIPVAFAFPHYAQSVWILIIPARAVAERLERGRIDAPTRAR
ncbi:MAG TPA: TMEM175 family protein [Caulobacteraceae bacterium]|jgi:uncharacterized membrane protein|nr:TMEM175 family protein [Caulobacteraceae bacterium]